MPHVPTWRRGHMVIVGDAAHAAAPASGQSASMAIDDAVVLAKSLSENPSVPAALATYEAVRRPRVERVVEYGARFSGAKAPGTVSRIIRDLMLPFVFKRTASPKSMRSMSWCEESGNEYRDKALLHRDPLAVAPIRGVSLRLWAQVTRG
jgi:2-polyprenyl-6-methoxyphenol hydroxylase-like FAD-dependent oxidoreductase